MIYRLAWIIVKVALWISFRKIKLNGIEHIPRDIPIIFTSNHPMGFLEPLVIATQIPRIFYYLARGDFFKNKTARWWLSQINILPIYRFRDGFSQMRNNDNAINNAVEILKEGKSFLVFAEGSTKLQRSFRLIQKGVARLMYEMLSYDPEMQIAIVPIGFSSSDMLSLNSEIHVEIGEAIFANALYSEQTSKPIFLKSLTKLVQNNSEQLVSQLRDPQDESLLDLIIRNTHVKDSFHQIKSIADQINVRSDEEKAKLRQTLESIETKRKSLNIKSQSLKVNVSSIDFILLVLGLLPFGVAYIVHFIPVKLSKWYADRLIKNKAFYAIILFVSSLVLMIIWYVLLIMIVVLKFGIVGLFPIICLILISRKNHDYYNLFNRVKDQIIHGSELSLLRTKEPFS